MCICVCMCICVFVYVLNYFQMISENCVWDESTRVYMDRDVNLK